MNLIMLGAPGAGKGTISKMLVEKNGVVQISTGDILRNEMKKGSDLGKKAKGYIDSGDLVPDDVILGIVETRLQEDDCKNGFILDGFPRTIAQAEGLKDIVKTNDLYIDAAVNIDVPEEELVKRLTSRRTCSNSSCQQIYNVITKPPKVEDVCDICGSKLVQRSDETEGAIKKRLMTYKMKTEPLIDHYSKEGILVEINGNMAPADVYSSLVNTLKK